MLRAAGRDAEADEAAAAAAALLARKEAQPVPRSTRSGRGGVRTIQPEDSELPDARADVVARRDHRRRLGCILGRTTRTTSCFVTTEPVYRWSCRTTTCT